MTAPRAAMHSEYAGWHLGYRPALDGLRAVAVSAVVAAHIGIPGLQGGVIGVDIFFVLSGFLITTLLVEERKARGGVDYGGFYARRARRLFPALAVLLPVVVVFARVSSTVDPTTARETTSAVPWVVFYAANWARAWGTELGLLGHTWSLAIEEQFYIVWPMALSALIGRRLNYRRALIGSLTMVAAVAVWRAFEWTRGAGIGRVYNGSDMRADALLIGCALAIALQADMRLRIPRVLTAAAVVFLGWVIGAETFMSPFLYVGGLTLIALATALVIVWLLEYPAILAAGPLVWLGRISYGVYLWHFPINAGLPLSWSLPVRALVVVSATLAAATTSWWVVERHFLARNRGTRLALPSACDTAGSAA